jgi:hypothetical protein
MECGMCLGLPELLNFFSPVLLLLALFQHRSRYYYFTPHHFFAPFGLLSVSLVCQELISICRPSESAFPFAYVGNSSYGVRGCPSVGRSRLLNVNLSRRSVVRSDGPFIKTSRLSICIASRFNVLSKSASLTFHVERNHVSSLHPTSCRAFTNRQGAAMLTSTPDLK